MFIYSFKLRILHARTMPMHDAIPHPHSTIQCRFWRRQRDRGRRNKIKTEVTGSGELPNWEERAKRERISEWNQQRYPTSLAHSHSQRPNHQLIAMHARFVCRRQSSIVHR